MSEEKLYMVKNDKGYYWDFNNLGGLWKLSSVSHTATFSEAAAKNTVKHYGGHVVTLIEEPKKVVLTKEQAEIVEYAHYAKCPASYISGHTGSSYGENQLMNAYVNGYTVGKQKEYLVELGGLVTTDGAKQYLAYKDGKWFASRRMSGIHQYFTDEELNKAPEWAQQLNREEMTDDEQ